MSAERRLFFALGLQPALQQQIIQWRAAHFAAESGRPIAAANLHLTLAFLGDVSDKKMQVLTEVAGRLRSPAISLTLDDVGHWPGSGVVWLGTRRAPRALLQLADLLRSHAARNGCHQSALPFHPHVSLLRGATKPVTIPSATDKWAFQPTNSASINRYISADARNINVCKVGRYTQTSNDLLRISYLGTRLCNSLHHYNQPHLLSVISVFWLMLSRQKAKS